jgi:hypothetical protein
MKRPKIINIYDFFVPLMNGFAFFFFELIYGIYAANCTSKQKNKYFSTN